MSGPHPTENKFDSHKGLTSSGDTSWFCSPDHNQLSTSLSSIFTIDFHIPMRDINKTNNELSIPMELPFFEKVSKFENCWDVPSEILLWFMSFVMAIWGPASFKKKQGGSRCHFPPASRFGVVLHKLLILGIPRYTAKNLCQTIPNSWSRKFLFQTHHV